MVNNVDNIGNSIFRLESGYTTNISIFMTNAKVSARKSPNPKTYTAEKRVFAPRGGIRPFGRIAFPRHFQTADIYRKSRRPARSDGFPRKADYAMLQFLMVRVELSKFTATLVTG